MSPQCKNSPKKKEKEREREREREREKCWSLDTWAINLMSFGDVEDESNNGDVPCKAKATNVAF